MVFMIYIIGYIVINHLLYNYNNMNILASSKSLIRQTNLYGQQLDYYTTSTTITQYILTSK